MCGASQENFDNVNNSFWFPFPSIPRTVNWCYPAIRLNKMCSLHVHYKLYLRLTLPRVLFVLKPHLGMVVYFNVCFYLYLRLTLSRVLFVVKPYFKDGCLHHCVLLFIYLRLTLPRVLFVLKPHFKDGCLHHVCFYHCIYHLYMPFIFIMCL